MERALIESARSLVPRKSLSYYARKTVPTLTERIITTGPLDPNQAMKLGVRLVKCLEELHAFGEPCGFLSADAVVIDMLIDQVELKQVAPKRTYFSPERLKDDVSTFADDVWAVGITIYFALTGSHPFVAKNEAETLSRIESGKALPLAVFDVGDDELQRIFDGILRRDLELRTSKLKGLAMELGEYKYARPVSSRRPNDEATVMREVPGHIRGHREEQDSKTVMRSIPRDLLDALHGRAQGGMFNEESTSDSVPGDQLLARMNGGDGKAPVSSTRLGAASVIPEGHDTHDDDEEDDRDEEEATMLRDVPADWEEKIRASQTGLPKVFIDDPPRSSGRRPLDGLLDAAAPSSAPPRRGRVIAEEPAPMPPPIFQSIAPSNRVVPARRSTAWVAIAIVLLGLLAVFALYIMAKK